MRELAIELLFLVGQEPDVVLRLKLLILKLRTVNFSLENVGFELEVALVGLQELLLRCHGGTLVFLSLFVFSVELTA